MSETFVVGNTELSNDSSSNFLFPKPSNMLSIVVTFVVLNLVPKSNVVISMYPQFLNIFDILVTFFVSKLEFKFNTVIDL